MISKCANPSCGENFRHLDQGQLFAYEIRKMKEPSHDVPVVICEGGRGRTTVCFWLCAQCCARFTLQFSPRTGLRLLPLLRGRESSSSMGLTHDAADLRRYA